MAEEPSYPTNVVVFKSDSPRTITPKFTRSGVTLQYSIDNGSTWNNISSGETTASSDEIWFRGRATGTKGLFTISDSGTNYSWVFSGDASNKLHVYGDLRYLLCDNLGDNTITFNIAEYCFAYMFYGCTSLTTAPSLPATTLARYCYFHMFEGCTSLTTPPSLPADTLANAYSCYSHMFEGCTSLTTAPELPATTLTRAYNCYDSMFRNCTSLTTAPSLPAITITSDCYSHMFEGCTSLTRAPSLPATTLVTRCYRFMFSGCTSLTTPPSLPATTLAESCYDNMFSGCTSLTTVPSLPATTMAQYCYNSMFSGCTALKVSATQTGTYQYEWRIPTRGTGTAASAYGWNLNMFSGTGGTFTGSPSINVIYYVENPPVFGFNITFEENGGITIPDIEEATELPTPLPTPTKSGYTFLGWYYDSDFTNEAFAGDALESNVTLYAKWELNTYTITFEENGGTTIPDVEDATKLPNPLPIPTKENHTFLGWFYDSDFTNEAFADDPLTSDITLYAKWQLNTYTITFNSNGGITIPDIEEATELPTPLPIPTKAGKVFAGWYYDSAFTQIANAGDTLESNVTLYAKWHITTQTNIRIYNGTTWFTLDGYSSYDCLNSLTYVNAPERTIGGTIPNLSSIPTFIVTTLFITYKLMPYQTYKDFINHINNKVEFVIEYFDVDTGLIMTKKFYLAPQSQRELFYARRGGVRSIDGILNITLEFISTNNEV